MLRTGTGCRPWSRSVGVAPPAPGPLTCVTITASGRWRPFPMTCLTSALLRMAQGFDSWDVIARGAKTHRSIIAHNVPKTGYAGALRVGPHKILLLGPSSSSIPGMQTTVGPFHRDFLF